MYVWLVFCITATHTASEPVVSEWLSELLAVEPWLQEYCQTYTLLGCWTIGDFVLLSAP